MSSEKNNWTIIKIEGSDKRLYNLVGPLVMNPDILIANENYPFRNTDHHVWYIAMSGKSRRVIGFLSVVGNHITNDYTSGNIDLLEALLEQALADQKTKTTIRFIAGVNELPLMEKLGFTVNKTGVKYYRVFKKIA